MNPSEKDAVKVGVPSADPQRKDTEKKIKEEALKLSEEDQQIKEQVELLVSRTMEPDAGVAKFAVDQLADLLRTSSGSSVASVPKPLKYIRSMYPDLERALRNAHDAVLIRRLHDVLSFVAMTLEFDDGQHVSLEHKLKGTQDDLGQWGHEYLRFLAGEVAAEWRAHAAQNESTSYLSSFVDQIVQYMLLHQDEPTSLDLLIETDQIQRIVPLVDESNYKRITSYASAMVQYLTRPTNMVVLGAVYEMYHKVGAYTDAVIAAIRLGDINKVTELFAECQDKATRLQMSLTCARLKVFLDLDDEEDELLAEANGNMRLSQLYRHAARSLDAAAPKSPEEIFKTGDEGSGPSGDQRYNLACTFVSGLVNCGHGKDKYLTEASTLLFDQKEDRITSTTAALGLLHLWDHTEGLQEIDKYFYSESNYIKAGACLASGITMCGVKNPFDPALALLSDHVMAPQREVAVGSILGLGYAYAGTSKEDVKELLIPLLADGEQSLEVQCMTAFALAHVFVGSADEDIVETMINCLLEVPQASLMEPCVRYLILALGGMLLGCQEAADTLLDATQTLSPLIQRYTEIVVRSCAFAGTGNVVVIQNLFHTIAENLEEEKEKNENENDDEESGAKEEEEEAEKPQSLNYKAAAVLGIGLVAMGEELGTEMAKRAIIHILLADTVSTGEERMSGRRAVPLVYALLSTSNPSMSVVETLNRLSHDSDTPTAANAILALGLVSAGSNNARVAKKLRNLASYYHKDKFADVLFVVRLAQGLCAMGKGHLTLSPLHNDRTSCSRPALMGLLGILHSALDLNATILDKYHYMLFSIAPSISPCVITSVNTEMEPLDGVQVRVGMPVDTVALPGKPKAITGFQTQTTPVLLSATDKAELADARYRALSSVIEGVVVVEPKPSA